MVTCCGAVRCPALCPGPFASPQLMWALARRLDRCQRVGDRGSGVGFLFADVAGDGGVVASRVRVGGVDPVHVAVDQLGDHAGENFGVADLEVPPAAVVVVLPWTGEVGQQGPVRCRGVSACRCVVGLAAGGGLSAEEQPARAAQPPTLSSSPCCRTERRLR